MLPLPPPLTELESFNENPDRDFRGATLYFHRSTGETWLCWPPPPISEDDNAAPRTVTLNARKEPFWHKTPFTFLDARQDLTAGGTAVAVPAGDTISSIRTSPFQFPTPATVILIANFLTKSVFPDLTQLTVRSALIENAPQAPRTAQETMLSVDGLDAPFITSAGALAREIIACAAILEPGFGNNLTTPQMTLNFTPVVQRLRTLVGLSLMPAAV